MAWPHLVLFSSSHIFWLITINKIILEKVYFRSQILERPSIGEYWNILVFQYCLKMWYLRSLEHAGVI